MTRNQYRNKIEDLQKFDVELLDKGYDDSDVIIANIGYERAYEDMLARKTDWFKYLSAKELLAIVALSFILTYFLVYR